MSKKQEFKTNKRNNFNNNKQNNKGPRGVSHHRKLMANFWSERLQRMICDGAMATLLASTREALQQQQTQPASEEGKQNEDKESNLTASEVNKTSVAIPSQGGIINSLILASTLNQAITNNHPLYAKRYADKETQTDPPVFTRFSANYQPNQHWVKSKRISTSLCNIQLQQLRPGVPKAATVYHTRPVR